VEGFWLWDLFGFGWGVGSFGGCLGFGSGRFGRVVVGEEAFDECFCFCFCFCCFGGGGHIVLALALALALIFVGFGQFSYLLVVTTTIDGNVGG